VVKVDLRAVGQAVVTVAVAVRTAAVVVAVASINTNNEDL